MHSNENIDQLLKNCSVKHVIIKKSEEPPKIGDDIDIFCEDAREMLRQIFHLISGGLGGTTIRVAEHEHHIHVDFLVGDVLQIRLDLIDTLDNYKETILEGDMYAELGIRLLEYAKHPHKTKHLNYVQDVLSKR